MSCIVLRGIPKEKIPPNTLGDGNTEGGIQPPLETALMNSAHLDLQILCLFIFSLLVLTFYIVQLMHHFSKSSFLWNCRKKLSLRGHPRWRWVPICRLQWSQWLTGNLPQLSQGPVVSEESHHVLRDRANRRESTAHRGHIDGKLCDKTSTIKF